MSNNAPDQHVESKCSFMLGWSFKAQGGFHARAAQAGTSLSNNCNGCALPSSYITVNRLCRLLTDTRQNKQIILYLFSKHNIPKKSIKGYVRYLMEVHIKSIIFWLGQQ